MNKFINCSRNLFTNLPFLYEVFIFVEILKINYAASFIP